jgi:2-methylcitrate dehydratase PrpD
MAGNRQGMKEGATLRNWYASHSAVMGQTAVRLIASGFTAPRDGVAATCGEVLFDNFRPDEVVRDLGQRWLTADGYIKLYGCGRPIHAAIDALRDALAPLGDASNWPDAAQIERIDVRGFKFLAFLNGRDIRNAFATRFSTPFALASVLTHRSHGVECFDDAAAADGPTLALMNRITLEEVDAFSAEFPHRQRCELRIVLRDGRVLPGRCDVIRGEPSHPAPESDLRGKFFNMALKSWTPEPAERLYAQLLRIDEIDDLSTLQWQGDAALAPSAAT